MGKAKFINATKLHTYNPQERIGIKQLTKERKNMDKAIYALVQTCIVICTDKSNIYLFCQSSKNGIEPWQDSSTSIEKGMLMLNLPELYIGGSRSGFKGHLYISP